jgi:hypothetical protein
MPTLTTEQNKPSSFFLLEGSDAALDPFTLRHAEGRAVRLIRGRKCHTKQAFFDEVGAALQFPYYFGENWDAFDECINDLTWLPAQEYILIISNAEQLLMNDPAKQLAF